MEQEVMFEHCRKMLFALQKIRSNEKEYLENMGGVTPEVAKNIFELIAKWTAGSHGEATLKGLQKVIDRGYVSPMEFYNFMTIAYKFDSGIINLWLSLLNESLPEPDTEWLKKGI